MANASTAHTTKIATTRRGFRARVRSPWRSSMIQHEVQGPAAQRYVEPEWRRSSCDGAMPRKIADPAAANGGQRKRHDGGGEHLVRNEHREIRAPQPAVTAKRHRADARVVDQVGHEEH